MIWIVWISLFLAFLYLLSFILVYYGQERLLLQVQTETATPSLSVVIPFRNEKAHLESLIRDLLLQDYPAERVEYLFIDDHSDDGGPELLMETATREGVPVRLIRLTGRESGKKAAIRKGIGYSRAPLILTLDADTGVPSGWIRNMVQCRLDTHAEMILGPVILKGSGCFAKLQSAEMMGNMALTAGWAGLGRPVMANGANLLFTREAYREYAESSHDPYISGDDMFLMQYLVQQKKKIGFCFKREAAVTTPAARSLREFYHQRLRWAGKAGGYRLALIWYNILLIFMMNFMIWVTLIGSFFSWQGQLALIILLLIKVAMEYLVCYPVATVLDLRSIHLYLPLVSLLHLVYIPWVGLSSRFVKYRWKGRRYSFKKQYGTGESSKT